MSILVEELSSRFVYTPDSPSGLVWKVNTYRGWNKQIQAAVAGTQAGALNPNGYWYVHYRSGRYLKAHRIVWMLHFGEIPPLMEIDHVDGDRGNNLIENLRLGSHASNCRNRKLSITNTSGVVGVKLNLKKWKGGVKRYWQAKVSGLDGRVSTKHFSIDTFGNEAAFEMACSWREAAIKELNKEGAGYTERHGKEII